VRAIAGLNRWDVLLPAAVALLGAVELTLLHVEGWYYGILLEALACLFLVWRRHNALLFATLAELVVLVIPYVGPRLDQPSTPIFIIAMCAYALGRWIADLRGLVGLAFVAVMMFADYVLVDSRSHNWSDVVFVAALICPPYVFGRITRQLSSQKALLEERAELVRREAVRDERDRIAREMHDVIAHSISAMVVQTAAAQDLVRTDPDRAEQVLSDVAATGRRALSETGRLLHVLRDEDDELGLTPAPGLADLAGLVNAFRASGLDVDLEVTGPLPPLPAGVDVSAYRIVQEALTNALRYGADRTARLRVATTPEVLRIEATNPSRGAPSAGSGLGLLGMAERVSLLGGSLTHGVNDGRFELAATLPVRS
jgi:signal transduction histidine kinase